MSKPSSDSLFRLIHSMSKTEKRHFKLYARYHSPGTKAINYLYLFDNIARQKEYDENAIQEKNLVKKEHLRMLKHYLFNLILESLRVLRSNKATDVEAELGNLLQNAYIMREKGIEQEEGKFLDRAKKISLERERWGFGLQSILQQSEKMTRDLNLAALKQNEEEIFQLIKKIENLFAYKKLRRSAIEILRTYDTQKAVRNNKEIKKIINHPLIRKTKNGITAASVKEGMFARLMCLTGIGDYEGTLKLLKVAEKFIEENYPKLDAPEAQHASVLSNMAARQMETGKFKEAFATIQKHRSLPTRSSTAKEFILIFSYINETNYYLATGEFEKGIRFISEIENELQKLKSLRQYMYTYVVYFNAASILFSGQKYENALRLVRKIINAPHKAVPEDVKAWSHIITILIHYEMKTHDILEHLTISAKNFLKKRTRLYKVEECILKFMQRQNKISANKKEIENEFQNFKNEINEIIKDPHEAKALMYFDLLSWIESKIQNKSMAEIVKEKLN